MILFIAGKMSAGKTTLAEMLAEIARSNGKSVQMVKFADPLYRLQSEIYSMAGLPVVKNRGLMQALGDAVRQNIGQDYFENAVEEAIRNSKEDIVIVDDMRFAGEVTLAKKIGATTVKVEATFQERRRRGEALGTWSETSHASENGLAGESFRHVIYNNGSLDELREQAKMLIPEYLPHRPHKCGQECLQNCGSGACACTSDLMIPCEWVHTGISCGDYRCKRVAAVQ